MELMELVVIAVASGIVSAFLSLVAAIVSHYLRIRDVDALHARVESVEMAVRGAKGRSSRSEKEERMQMALAEGFALFQAGKKPEEIMKEMLAKYPDLAFQVAKQNL